MTAGRIRIQILAFSFGIGPGSFLISEAAPAQSRKNSQRAAVKVEKIKRKKKDTKAKALKEGGSYNQADMVGSGLEKKLIKGIDKTLQFLKRTVKQMPPKSGARLEMLERILNLSLEQAAYVASAEQDEYDKKWRAWARGGRKTKEPKLNTRKSNGHWQKVYGYSRSISREYPKSPRADQIAFNGALALQFLGKEKQATREFLRIIKNFPKSSVAGDAYFSLGDYYFDRNDFRTAMGHYESSIKYKRSKRYGWALFKLGWCHYNLSRYNRSLDTWKKTVKQSDRVGGKRGLRLKEEAMRDMIFAYAELRKIDEAISFYRKNGGEEHIAKLLKLLAETFSDQGKFRNSIKTWKRLLNLYPYSGEAFDAQAEIVALSYEDQNYKTLWNELENLVKNFSLRSKWAASVGKKDRERVINVQKDIKRLSLYYPKIIHKEGQKINNRHSFRQAQKGYRLFIRHYPKSQEIPEVKEYLGDLEFFQNNYREAGKIYLEIALMGKNKAIIFDDKGRPKENIHKRSAQNMLDSYNKDFLPELKGLLKLKPDFRKPPRSLSVRAQNFIKGCGYYIKWYPRDTKTIKNCETFTSDIYFHNQNKKMALRYLWLIATKYANHKEGPVAVDNLIPLYQNDKKGLFSAARKLLSVKAYQRGKIGKKLRNLMRGMEIEAIAGEKNDLKRAKMYESQAKASPRDKDADKFWNNAAVDFLKAGYLPGAIAAFTKIVTSYPRSKLYGAALLQLGQLQDSQAEYTKAAQYYLLYATKFVKAKEAPGAMERACAIQTAFELNKAVSTCTNFARRYPRGGLNAVENLITALWRQRNYNVMTRVILNNYVNRFRLSANQKILAHYKIFMANRGRGARAKGAMRDIIRAARSGQQVEGEALRYLGEIAFNEVQPLQKRFFQLRLQGGNVNRLQSSIEAIFGALVQLEQAYQQVFASRDAFWGIAAFYQLGYSYESFANQLRSPPAINGVKQEDLVNQLKASVDQVQGKSKEYYTTGIQTVRQFTIFSDWSVRIFNGLNRIVKRRVSFEEWIVSPDFIGSEASQKVRSAIY